jgi:hypothetical protein
MTFFMFKVVLSGLLIGIISEVARRSPGFAALIASLPLVSIIAMVWMWRDNRDVAGIASHSAATFWYVLPSMPMFLLLPWLLRHDVGFWQSLAAGCLLTIGLYALLIWAAPRLGIAL